jgi:hypothetical protein
MSPELALFSRLFSRIGFLAEHSPCAPSWLGSISSEHVRLATHSHLFSRPAVEMFFVRTRRSLGRMNRLVQMLGWRVESVEFEVLSV